jgi:hypothetical protein
MLMSPVDEMAQAYVHAEPKGMSRAIRVLSYSDPKAGGLLTTNNNAALQSWERGRDRPWRRAVSEK